MMYIQHPPSLPQVEDLLSERGIDENEDGQIERHRDRVNIRCRFGGVALTRSLSPLDFRFYKSCPVSLMVWTPLAASR